MKKILLGLFFFLITTSLVSAQENWEIESFNADLKIKNDGWIEVTEEIKADFGFEEKHGIYRDIPTDYQDKFGNKIQLNLEVVSVSDGSGNSWKYDDFKNSKDKRIKIGDPLETVNGLQTFEIRYRVKGAINFFSDHDELYWNVTGNNWPVPINLATIQVSAPDNPTNAICFTGEFGSTFNNCEVKLDTSVFGEASDLQAGEGLTLVTSYPVGTVNKPAVWQNIFRLLILNLGYLIPVVVLIWLINHYWKNGRDDYFIERFDDDKNNVTMPLFAREVVADRYYPPDNLTAVELGVIIDERVNNQDLAAMMIDLAERGVIKITELSKGKFDLTKINTHKAKLKRYEELLVNGIFAKDDKVSLASLKYKFAPTAQKVSDELYAYVSQGGYFVGDPNKVRMKYYLTGAGLSALGIVFFLFGSSWFSSISFGVGVVISGILFMLFARSMPKRTNLGRQVLLEALGLKRVIKLGAYRQQLFEKENYFNEILPFAIAFGLTKQWANSVKTMNVVKPDWYEGSGNFSASMFGSSMRNFSKVSSNNLTAVKSSSAASGSSGFSGGSCGGGFGGGGGGSW
jgi:uncharacterized membrane protein